MGYGHQVFGRVPGQVAIQPGADDKVVLLAHHHVVACGGGLDGFGDTDGAASAGLVVRHHSPVVRLGELVGHQSRQDVGAATGRKGHDQADRFGRVGRGLGCGGASQAEQGDQGCKGGNQKFVHGAWDGQVPSGRKGRPV